MRKIRMHVIIAVSAAVLLTSASTAVLGIFPREVTTSTKEDTQNLLVRADGLLNSVQILKDEWNKAADEFSNALESRISEVEEMIEDLKLALDFGDENLRKDIFGKIENLERRRDTMKEINDELRAAHAVDVANVMNRFQRMIEDIQAN